MWGVCPAGRPSAADAIQAMMRRVALFAFCGLLALALASPSLAAETASEAKLAYVTVAGAPGDGEQSLAAALSKRLLAAGVQAATTIQTNVYDVQGTVRVEPAPGGKQSVRIVWVVFAPDGDQLGIVSQTKEVRKGALDKKWGAAADAAASAAVDQIIALLPH